ncbi:hypothetical protein [Streptomyces liliifuscus]|uniref:Uncharacterized protein n=1 Tax=Streptomyces liliifuscus TaxID=2797636 RepID=A0A7T7KWY7_9ACTN|nr:hypothetical protein [Streptomyces liliifuscus]QQM41690.1 hypothetical protein JEQ17_21030 [Streptomyces liliifuscus]
MGIESDQVVYEYLSRVGDVAQQRQLPSGVRMRLVSELRNEIDRRRAKATIDSPAAVRRILERLGTPESVVAAANADTSGGEGPAEPRAAVPTQRAQEPEPRSKRLRRVVPRPRPAEPDVPATADAAPSPPHLASAEELGSGQPDWWRVESSPFGSVDSVPGFTGGIEIPELLKPPPRETDEPDPKPAAPVVPAAPAAPVEAAEADAAAGKKTRRLVPRLRPVGGGWTNPLLLLAAALLVAGAAIGNLVMLGLGWLIAYLSRRLSPTESKWAVLGVPGLAATAGIVWLWGRTEGRWGTPIADGRMNDAVAETWPWVLRGAAIASALYLVWRSQRPR